MTREEINKVLRLHQKWLVGNGGERADLREASLEGVNLEDADLRGADLEGVNLKRADLRGADLEGANLKDANFEKANLKRVNLTRANLEGANLEGADLWETNLKGANLEGADLKYVKNLPLPDLNILKHQKGKIRAFKVVNRENEGVFQGGIKYEIGKTIEERDYDPDEKVLCSRGLNVATLEWCLKNKGVSDKILVVECYAEDIVAIPYATNGKFRVKKCKVIGEWEGKI